MPKIYMEKRKVRAAAIRESAKLDGASCSFNFPGGCTPFDNLMWCHSNRQIHGKGERTKAHDVFGAIGCSYCHDVYDGRRRLEGYDRADREAVFDQAHILSLVFLFEYGVLVASRGGH